MSDILDQHRTLKSRSFKAVMTDATRSMTASQRTFSAITHQTFISSVSDVIGSVLLRPAALLGGAAFSFVVTLATYLLAKNLGYTLSGFEPLGAFIFGWFIGNAYDFLKLIITGNR